MPVHDESIKIATKKLAIPVFGIYGVTILFIAWLCTIFPTWTSAGIILIYVSAFGFGCFITFYNEKKIFSMLMNKEKEAYYESFYTETVGGKRTDEIVTCYRPIDNSPDYIQTQYDYYIRKTLLSQSMASGFLIALAGGILLDITINALNNNLDIWRTIILVGGLSLFSTLFLIIAILKHAEYNAGCAIYRNAILGIGICKKQLSENPDLKKYDLAMEIGLTLQNLRGGCKKMNCELKPDFLRDGLRTVELLELLKYIKIVPVVVTPAMTSDIITGTR